MQDSESIERIAYELAVDNQEEGVRYIEVRYAPQLHIHESFDAEEVVSAACRGLERAKKEHNAGADVKSGKDIPFEYGLILCALRFFTAEMSWYYRSLFNLMSYALEKRVHAMASLEVARLAESLAHEKGLPVVGFDLAGAEAGFPADDHREAFQYAHDHFIRKTVHAGEAYGPESIFQAITDCHANRIGHGTHLFATDRIHGQAAGDKEAYVRYLTEYIAGQRITLEVCLTSNLQTLPALKSASDHSLGQMLERNLSVSICTDNRLISNTSVCQELELAATELDLTPKSFRNIVVAGFKGSFFPGNYVSKRAYVRKFLDRYESLEQQFLQS